MSDWETHPYYVFIRKVNEMKKLLSALLASALCLGLAACGTTQNTENSEGKDASGYTVGICQLVQHDALDDATRGFQDALTEILGDEVTFEVCDGQNDYNACGTIINSFVSSDVDLILANSTPVLQVAAASTLEIPILGTAVTEYGAALQLADFSGVVGDNISGTSDLAPLNEQAAMVQEWFPEAENVGLLYCSAEANSQYQVTVVKAELEKLGFTCTMYPFFDSSDLSAVCTTAASNSDVIYVPTDNTVAANAGIIDNICRPERVPVIAGDEGTCSRCGVATLTISYYDLGYTTGQMAARILTGEENISVMPIEYTTATKKYNPEICQALGLTAIPAEYVALDAAE